MYTILYGKIAISRRVSTKGEKGWEGAWPIPRSFFPIFDNVDSGGTEEPEIPWR